MQIPGGYYIKARKIQESDIAHAPPHVREIWDWLLLKANHKTRNKIKRGQVLTTYSEILEGLSWHVGYRKQTYKKHHCETAMKYLTSRNMIQTTKTTRGMIVTICNYDTYQNPKNYETDSETGNESNNETYTSQDTIHKNVRSKNAIEDGSGIFVPTCLDTLYEIPKRNYDTWTKMFPNIDVRKSLERFASYEHERPIEKRRNPEDVCRRARYWLDNEKPEPQKLKPL